MCCADQMDEEKPADAVFQRLLLVSNLKPFRQTKHTCHKTIDLAWLNSFPKNKNRGMGNGLL